jgi:hypothetical protein
MVADLEQKVIIMYSKDLSNLTVIFQQHSELKRFRKFFHLHFAAENPKQTDKLQENAA